MDNQVNYNLLKLHKLGLIKPLVRISRRAREGILKNVSYNIGLIPAELTYIDLITDSLMHFILPENKFLNKASIEASYLSLNDTFKRFFGYKHVLPIAQGRMSEALFSKLTVKNMMVIPSNALFVTTRLHPELNGATVLEIPVSEAYDFKNSFPFKGNIDTEKLQMAISEHGKSWMPFIYIETCVNATGGHPVSMENIRKVSHIAKETQIPVFLDACRILENAYLIKEREGGFRDKSIADIVREFCSYTDGCTMSATKDFFVEQGGFFATNNENLYLKAQDAIMAFGDGLSVRAKASLNEIIKQTFKNEKWIRERVGKVSYLWNKLRDYDLPVLSPCGGHAVFLDAKELYDFIPRQNYPEKAFLVELYLATGIRAGENILSVYQKKEGQSILRLAIPARTYSRANLDYIAKGIRDIWQRKDKIRGLNKVFQPPSLTGEFFARYELLN